MTTFDLAATVAGLYRDGTSDVIDPPAGKPVRIDGFTVRAPFMKRSAPHRGEIHPDGDELLYLVSGAIDVVVETGGTQDSIGEEHVTRVEPGQAFIVPRGLWHRVEVREPSRLVHITPGPGDGHRPLA